MTGTKLVRNEIKINGNLFGCPRAHEEATARRKFGGADARHYEHGYRSSHILPHSRDAMRVIFDRAVHQRRILGGTRVALFARPTRETRHTSPSLATVFPHPRGCQIDGFPLDNKLTFIGFFWCRFLCFDFGCGFGDAATAGTLKTE
jgi:hypothetical protein